jgi:hypothetical protein
MEATEANIGNADMTLATPYYSSDSANSAFSINDTSTCGNGLMVSVGGSCTIDVTFAPVATGQVTQQVTVNSNAYNTGVPVLTIRGTGQAAGKVKKAENAKQAENVEPKANAKKAGKGK